MARRLGNQYYTSCDGTNPSKVQEQLYGHHTGGCGLGPCRRRCYLRLLLKALQAMAHFGKSAVPAAWHLRLIVWESHSHLSPPPTSVSFFGYTHLTGGWDGGQAEFVRVPYADLNCLKVGNSAASG